MLPLSKIRKAMYPQPVYVAHFIDGTAKRMSFYSPADKPLDTERGRAVALSVAFGKQFIAGHVEIEGRIVAYDDLNGNATKRKRGPTAKVCLQVIDGLLHNPTPELVAKARQLLAA